jgi:hypothetical protein
MAAALDLDARLAHELRPAPAGTPATAAPGRPMATKGTTHWRGPDRSSTATFGSPGTPTADGGTPSTSAIEW